MACILALQHGEQTFLASRVMPYDAVQSLTLAGWELWLCTTPQPSRGGMPHRTRGRSLGDLQRRGAGSVSGRDLPTVTQDHASSAHLIDDTDRGALTIPGSEALLHMASWKVTAPLVSARGVVAASAGQGGLPSHLILRGDHTTTRDSMIDDYFLMQGL